MEQMEQPQAPQSPEELKAKCAEAIEEMVAGLGEEDGALIDQANALKMALSGEEAEAQGPVSMEAGAANVKPVL